LKDLHIRLRTLLFLVPYVYRRGGVLVSELAECLNLSEQELFREFDFLMMVGRPPFMPDDLIDIYVEEGRVFVHLPSSLQNPPSFTVSETLALANAIQSFSRSSEENQALKQAFEKILASLPEQARQLVNELTDRTLVMTDPVGLTHLELLRHAIHLGQQVELDYYSASRYKVSLNRRVNPLGLKVHLGLWYLAAYCHLRKENRVFRISRMRSAILCPEHFKKPTDFDMEMFLKTKLTLPTEGEREILVRFSVEDSRWVAERFGEKYLSREADGSLCVKFHDVSDEFVLSYVASFAGRAHVVQPQELGKKLQREAQSALEMYLNKD
jgi:proteasome accessory factor C